MRHWHLALHLLIVAALSGCALDTETDALNSLGASRFSTTYHSRFWAAEAERKSPLWEKAQSYCHAPEYADAPNCRVAVDLPVRVLAIRQDEGPNERIRQWVRGGTRELGLSSPAVVPPYVPGKGFGPELPEMPAPPAR